MFHNWRRSCAAGLTIFLMTVLVRTASGQAGAGAGAPPRPVLATPPSNGSEILFDYFQEKQNIEDAFGTKIGVNIDLLNQSVFLAPGTPESRYVARYDLGFHQRLWAGAEADLDVRGGWGDGPDVDYGNTVNTDQYANTGSHIFVLHLWVQQKLFNDQLTLRGGKMDVGDFMDVNRFGYYNFVGYSFAHNFAIPLPGNPLAGMFTVAPNAAKWIYFSGAVANGAQSSYHAGFDELTHGPRALFALGELGFKTNFFDQEGIYRFEAWYDARHLGSIDGTGPQSSDRGGVAISFDQNVTKNLGLFVRWGYGNQHEFTPQQYWSAGFDWTGVIPWRPKDDVAIGLVQNIFSDERHAVVQNGSDNETYLEAYYNVYLTQWMQAQPFVQVVDNPGGIARATETIAGVHVGFRF
jgi:carbohydrate-selective porin OprB